MQDRGILAGVLIILLIPLRIIFNYNEQLLYIVACINIFALFVVLHTILRNSRNKIIRYIRSFPDQLVVRERRKINCMFGFVYILIFITYIVYLKAFCSECSNDIISILALGLSLFDDYIVDFVVNIYKK